MRATLSSIALAVAGLLPLGATAATLVDTGFNPAGTPWSFYSFQGLAASFSVASTVSIGSIEAYFRTESPTTVPLTVSLFANAPGGTPLYSGSSAITPGVPANWYGLSGLRGWTVGPGTYSVAFTTSDPTGRTVLLGNAPHPLAAEYYGGAPGWTRYDPLELAVRITSVSAVPEPETGAMLLAGLGAMGFAARRRRFAGT